MATSVGGARGGYGSAGRERPPLWPVARGVLRGYVVAGLLVLAGCLPALLVLRFARLPVAQSLVPAQGLAAWPLTPDALPYRLVDLFASGVVVLVAARAVRTGIERSAGRSVPLGWAAAAVLLTGIAPFLPLPAPVHAPAGQHLAWLVVALLAAAALLRSRSEPAGPAGALASRGGRERRSLLALALLATGLLAWSFGHLMPHPLVVGDTQGFGSGSGPGGALELRGFGTANGSLLGPVEVLGLAEPAAPGLRLSWLGAGPPVFPGPSGPVRLDPRAERELWVAVSRAPCPAGAVRAPAMRAIELRYRFRGALHVAPVRLRDPIAAGCA